VTTDGGRFDGENVGQLIDLTGQTFGRLVVIERAGSHRGYIVWRCRCACGKEIVTLSSNLRCGDTRSCGCLRHEVLKAGVKRGYGTMATRLAAARQEAASLGIDMRIGTRLNTAEAAAYLGFAPRTLEHWRHQGRGPVFVRISPGCVRYMKSALDDFIAEHSICSQEN
jgi:Helix-turn-helix domain